jgi:hypothetical protein
MKMAVLKNTNTERYSYARTYLETL